MGALLDLLPLAGIGALAAFLAALAKSHRLELPRVVRQNGDQGTVTLIDLGFLGAPLLGALVSLVVDGGPKQAFLYGMASGIIGPAILNTLMDPLLAKLGLPPAAAIAGDNGDAAVKAPDSGGAAGSQSNG